MVTATTVPLEVYLCSSYEPDADYVDGVIEERLMGEYDHSAWQLAVLAYFLKHPEWRVKAMPELRVQVSPTRFRVPDITVLDVAAPREQIVITPPLMVFEILSPEDIMHRVLVKLSDYERMGIQGIFVIDPAGQASFVYQAGSLERVGDHVVIAGRQIDFNEISKLLA
jgi:Uma2 family endonuclease